MSHFTTVVLSQVIYPSEDIWQHLETFLVAITEGNATGIQWVEAKGAAKHSIIQRAAPTAKNDSAQNVDSAELEKLLTTAI